MDVVRCGPRSGVQALHALAPPLARIASGEVATVSQVGASGSAQLAVPARAHDCSPRLPPAPRLWRSRAAASYSGRSGARHVGGRRPERGRLGGRDARDGLRAVRARRGRPGVTAHLRAGALRQRRALHRRGPRRRRARGHPADAQPPRRHRRRRRVHGRHRQLRRRPHGAALRRHGRRRPVRRAARRRR